MAASYKPNAPFSTALILLIPTYLRHNGVRQKNFPDVEDGILFFGSFKTYGGTETTENGIFSVLDTATVECWFRPDISSDCRIAIAGTNRVYDVFGEPENIDVRNQYLRFTVRAVKGGA